MSTGRTVIVVHESYGCDTGCCGHSVYIDGERAGEFDFDHPYGQDHHEYVRDLVTAQFGEDHVKDIDWAHCIVVED